MKRIVSGAAVAAALAAASCWPAAAASVYSNDFSTSLNGFTAGTIETAPLGEKLLSSFDSGGTSVTISGLAANSPVSLSFTLDVIGSMDGSAGGAAGPDFFNVDINGTLAFSKTFANYAGNTQNYPTTGSAPTTGNDGINTLGYSTFVHSTPNVQDAIYNLVISGSADATGVATIAFFDLSNEPRINEYYGIDNVSVDGTVAAVATPLPAALPMFAGGLGGLGFLARRRRKQAAV